MLHFSLKIQQILHILSLKLLKTLKNSQSYRISKILENLVKKIFKILVKQSKFFFVVKFFLFIQFCTFWGKTHPSPVKTENVTEFRKLSKTQNFTKTAITLLFSVRNRKFLDFQIQHDKTLLKSIIKTRFGAVLVPPRKLQYPSKGVL